MNFLGVRGVAVDWKDSSFLFKSFSLQRFERFAKDRGHYYYDRFDDDVSNILAVKLSY